MKAELHHASNMARMAAAFKRHRPGCDLSPKTHPDWAIYATNPADRDRVMARQLTCTKPFGV